jgi:hypothetical protein
MRRRDLHPRDPVPLQLALKNAAKKQTSGQFPRKDQRSDDSSFLLESEIVTEITRRSLL